MAIILGLGSNIGDRLAYLRVAHRLISQIPNVTIIATSPLYISDALLPEDAPLDWDMPYLNYAVMIDTTLTPFVLHEQTKRIEQTIGRPNKRHWGPRTIDIDILTWNNEVINTDLLTIPHPRFHERPFQAWPVADLAPLWVYPQRGNLHGLTAAQLADSFGSRFTGQASCHTRQINQRVDGPDIVGIINVTPDSCSDGGLHLNPEQALASIEKMVATGASVIDIGAESTSPQATAIDVGTEWQRLEPVLQGLKKLKPRLLLPTLFSLDTRHLAVAKRALAYDIDWINDVSGLDDPAMRKLIAESSKDCVIMHHINIPESNHHHLPRDTNPVDAVLHWGETRIAELELAGIPRQKIIFDPGIGFGKLAEQSLVALRHIDAYKTLGVRCLVGYSRKRFMGLFTALPYPERDIETNAVTAWVATRSVDYVRVHNVAATAQTLKVAKALGK